MRAYALPVLLLVLVALRVKSFLRLWRAPYHFGADKCFGLPVPPDEARQLIRRYRRALCVPVLAEAVAVATDGADRVYVFNRGARPVLVFRRDGTFLHSWGEGLFTRPHGIFVGPDDTVYCADDFGHTVNFPSSRIVIPSR